MWRGRGLITPGGKQGTDGEFPAARPGIQVSSLFAGGGWQNEANYGQSGSG